MQLHGTGIGFVVSGLLLGLGLATVNGCDAAEAAGDIAKQCGLDVDCTAGGFAEGKASISGIASIDAFFGAAIDLEASLTTVSGELRGELDAIGASVGLEPGAGGAELQGAIDTYLAGFVDGSLSIAYQPARCQASVEATVAAAAECDVEVEPGEVSASCSGSCKAEAGVEVECGADAELMCSGTAPNLECSGTCTGSCSLEFSAAAQCDGTCRGTCEAAGGTMDEFEGRCNGECQGECSVDMSAGGSCDAGRCDGNCEYTAPEAGCEASASASCEANAGASIECDAGCEGTVEPPEVSAECEASVEAKASASLSCTPPTLAFEFQWAGGVAEDLQAQAQFRAWLEGFRLHFGALLAARAKGDVVVEAAANLAAAAEGAVKGAVDELTGDASLKAAIGAKCALNELPVAGSALVAAQKDLAVNLSAAVDVVAAF